MKVKRAWVRKHQKKKWPLKKISSKKRNLRHKMSNHLRKSLRPTDQKRPHRSNFITRREKITDIRTAELRLFWNGRSKTRGKIPNNTWLSASIRWLVQTRILWASKTFLKIRFSFSHRASKMKRKSSLHNSILKKTMLLLSKRRMTK